MKKKEMQYQVNKDLANRSFTGSFIYVIIWFSIFLTHELYIVAANECFWISLVFIVLAVARLIMIKNFDDIYRAKPTLWKLFFFTLLILTAITWLSVCLLSLVNPVYEGISLTMIIATAGITGGGGASLAPNKKLSLFFIGVLLIPIGITICFFSTNKDFVVGLLFFIYWIGMFSVISTQHKEYRTGLRNSFLLKEYAAKLEELNTIDSLTGLKNRAFFDQSLHLELKKASRIKSPISLLMIDIDHFKKLNDRFGHLCGDECLKAFSTLLSNMQKRETDVVARFGGEEFVIILPGMTTEQSLLFAEKIRQATEEIKLEYAKETVCFTASIGIANITPDMDTTAHMVIDAADIALYSAKENGRNQVICNNLER